MDKLKIEWHKSSDNHSEGFMEINLEAFFPCTVEKALKVFHLVNRWCSDETIDELEQYFLNKVEQSELLATDCEIKKEYSKRHQAVTDNKSLVETQKHPNGVPCTYDQWIAAKKQIQEDEQWMKKAVKTQKARKLMVCKYERMLKLFYASTSGHKLKGSDC